VEKSVARHLGQSPWNRLPEMLADNPGGVPMKIPKLYLIAT
jgi:hypothetical protein